MRSPQDIFEKGDIHAWREHINDLHALQAAEWADRSFFRLVQYHGKIEPFVDETKALAGQVGWGGADAPWASFTEAMRRDKWSLIPLMLEVAPRLDLADKEIDYLAVKALDKGLWPQLDLLRASMFMDTMNVQKMGHDIFKHNRGSYYSPLNENTIRQLVQLPKHEQTSEILGHQFAYTQRDDGFTDLEKPGVLSSLVIMVDAGWLDLDAARSILQPNEGKILARIPSVESAVLARKIPGAKGVKASLRI
jgi:hypothetical protein